MHCKLCEREANLHPHHLIPRKFLKKKKGGRKIQVSISPLIEICTDCEKTIHALFTLKELRDIFNTIEILKNEERMIKYIKWIKDKPVGIVRHPRRSWKGGKYE